MSLFVETTRLWHRIEPPNDATAEFSADLERLIDAYHAIDNGPMEDEVADYASVLESAAWHDDRQRKGDATAPGLCETADAVARGDLAAEDVTRYCLETIAAENPTINAVIRHEPETALEQARASDTSRMRGGPLGPLHGIPLAHKDMFYRRGQAVSCGSVIRESFVSDRTATVLECLDSAGALQIAALNMSEFAQGPTGHNRHFGPVCNPWNVERVSGGSSSGSGAAVSSGMVLASLGSDTGGSVRIPASLCGVTGLKPTWSRVSRYGVMPLAPSLDCIGPLARSARDCARLLAIIARADELDGTASDLPVPRYEQALDGDVRGIRIGLPENWFFDGVDPSIQTRFDAALQVLLGRGGLQDRIRLPEIDRIAVYSSIVSKVEVATLHADWMRSRARDYAIHVSGRMYPGYAIPATFYVEAMRRRGAILKAFMEGVFSKVDVLAMPTLRITAPTIAETDVDVGAVGAVAKFLSLSANTRPFNYLGLPAITVPIGLDSQGLPAGLQLVGRPFSEALLLRLADALQRDTDWHLKRPPSRNTNQ